MLRRWLTWLVVALSSCAFSACSSDVLNLRAFEPLCAQGAEKGLSATLDELEAELVPTPNTRIVTHCDQYVGHRVEDIVTPPTGLASAALSAFKKRLGRDDWRVVVSSEENEQMGGHGACYWAQRHGVPTFLNVDLDAATQQISLTASEYREDDLPVRR